MSIIAQTADYLVETEAGLLTISRYSDGYCKACHALERRPRGDRHASNVAAFRSDLAQYGAERAIRAWINGHMHDCAWCPMYKPERMPRA